jgi:hypothetical protein
MPGHGGGTEHENLQQTNHIALKDMIVFPNCVLLDVLTSAKDGLIKTLVPTITCVNMKIRSTFYSTGI